MRLGVRSSQLILSERLTLTPESSYFARFASASAHLRDTRANADTRQGSCSFLVRLLLETGETGVDRSHRRLDSRQRARKQFDLMLER